MKTDNIPNQVFIGCPWKIVRGKYEELREDLKKKYPLSFIIIGRGGNQHAEDLLKIIKDELLESSAAIFDATGGNANVSLEYGIAEAEEIPRAIYISQHGRGKTADDSAIISDLAGKKRNEYKQLNSLSRLLNDFSRNHVYTKKFENFFRKKYIRLSKGSKKSVRALVLKIIHSLDGKDTVRRTDVVQDLIAQGYGEAEVNDCIKDLHGGRLIRCSEGRYSVISIV